jgi:putative membrane protein
MSFLAFMPGGATLLAGPFRDWGDMDQWHHMAGWGVFAGILGLLMMVILVMALVWAIRAAIGHGSSPAEPPSKALDLLDERFARGEIDREEYLAKKADLRR